MAAKFEVKASGSGYQWVLSSQGRTLATSPTYSRKAMAEKAIVSFRMAALAAPVNDTTPTRAKAPLAKVARTAGRAAGKVAAVGAEVVDQAEKTVKRATRGVRGTAKSAATQAGTARRKAAKG